MRYARTKVGMRHKRCISRIKRVENACVLSSGYVRVVVDRVRYENAEWRDMNVGQAVSERKNSASLVTAEYLSDISTGVLGAASRRAPAHGGPVHVHERPTLPGHPPAPFRRLDAADQVSPAPGLWHL